MHHLLLDGAEGGVAASLQTFCAFLRRDAEALVRRCGELIGMEDEASAILRRCALDVTTPERAESPAELPALGSLEGVAVPTAPLYFGAVATLSGLLHPQAGHTSAGARGERCVAENFAVLLKVTSLYCLATSRPPTEASCDLSSAGSSGRTTPLTRPSRRQNHHHHQQQQQYSASNNAGHSDIHSSVEAEDQLMEARMAEEVFRVSVDAVVRLSTYGLSRQEESGTLLAHESKVFADLQAEVRMAALYLLATTLMRFRNALFNAVRYLPALFPEVDARDPHVTHPLLTPLLWDRENRVRCSASALVISLLRKLHHNFKYAEEPQQKRQSFSSLASQSGRTLTSLHDALLWALQSSGGVSVANEVSTVPAVFHSSKGIILSSFSALVASTPYHRCPHAFDVVQRTLALPFLRDVLLRDTCEEFVPVTAFLSNVFRAEPLVGMVKSQLSCGETTDIIETTDVNYCGLERETGGNACLLDALLTHAATRVEVWRCVVQLARMHPWIVGTHFAVMMEASCGVLHATSEAIENSQNTESIDHTKNRVVTAGLTLGECLRAWLHFMGYVWRSFDGCPADPALRQDYGAHRATLQQKRQIVEKLVLPVLVMAANEHSLHDALRAALRCVAQLGDEYLSSMPLEKLEEMVEHVISNTTAYDSTVRAEVFTTMGVWAWQYNTFDKWLPDFVERALCALCDDAVPAVRFKSAFTLSNITSSLSEKEESSTLRRSAHHMQILCDVAMYATQSHQDPVVIGHGIRMMSHLLQSLSFEELISELSGEQLGVAEGYFSALLSFLLPSNRDAKLRWNAAYALGLGLSREVAFEAEPQGATRAVERLCVVVCHDRIFKVRTQAALALARVPMTCLASKIYAAEDLTPKVARALCEALRVSSGSTETYTQYKEQDTLCAALRQALGVMITGAAPSDTLQRVFAEYRELLKKEALL